jgi:hypothetical protein
VTGFEEMAVLWTLLVDDGGSGIEDGLDDDISQPH